jgi:acetoin utilization protein AcuB
MNYLLSKVTVRDVMTKNVLTVSEDTPIEEAARIMADNKIGGLPVMQGDHLAGIITETDLFKIFLELMGAREVGVRASVMISDKKGSLARLTQAIANCGGNFVAFGQFHGEDSSSRLVTMKVRGIDAWQLQAALEPVVLRVIDIRASYP